MAERIGPREVLAGWVSRRVQAKGAFERSGTKFGTYLLQDVQVKLDGEWFHIGHVWLQKATALKAVNPQNGDMVAFTAIVQPYESRENYSLQLPENVEIVNPIALRVPEPPPALPPI